MKKSNNQTYIHLYIDFPIHKYICDRSLSGDLFHIVNPFLSAKGLSSVIQHTFPTKSQFRQSVCLSLPDLGFNILPIHSYFDQVLGSSHYPHLLFPTPTSFGDY